MAALLLSVHWSLPVALQVPVDFLLRSSPLVLSRRASVVTEDPDTEVARESGSLDLALVAWLHDVQQLVELGVLQPGPLLRASALRQYQGVGGLGGARGDVHDALIR